MYVEDDESEGFVLPRHLSRGVVACRSLAVVVIRQLSLIAIVEGVPRSPTACARSYQCTQTGASSLSGQKASDQKHNTSSSLFRHLFISARWKICAKQDRFGALHELCVAHSH